MDYQDFNLTIKQMNNEEQSQYLAEKFWVACTAIMTGDECTCKDGYGTNYMLREQCPGYEYYGHEPLDIVGNYATCEYIGDDWRNDADIHAPDNQKVAALVREALQRDNPLDEWLDDQLNEAHLGDTAIRESAYYTVMTNIPHPPCAGLGYLPVCSYDALYAACKAKKWALQIETGGYNSDLPGDKVIINKVQYGLPGQVIGQCHYSDDKHGEAAIVLAMIRAVWWEEEVTK